MNISAPRLVQPIAIADDIAWAGLRRRALTLDRAIGAAAEMLGAALVVAEICILFAGVVSRYGPTSSPISCSCGWRCWEPSSRCAATNICA